MLERLKSIDYMYWASLIFMVFPIVPVVTGELPSWHLLIDILFVVAYLGVDVYKRQSLLFGVVGLQCGLKDYRRMIWEDQPKRVIASYLK